MPITNATGIKTPKNKAKDTPVGKLINRDKHVGGYNEELYDHQNKKPLTKQS
jgi:hypothetical protein